MARIGNRGVAGIEAGAAKSGGRFAPEIRWDGGETKYVQFITPIEDVATLLSHPFVIIAYREDGGIIPSSFISRRDPTLDGPEGYDELEDRFNLQPKQRSYGVAVELEPHWTNSGGKKTLKGFTPQRRQFETKDGETKDVPAVGLVVQSPSIFYSHLAANAEVDPIQDQVFKVKRIGKDKNTQYNFIRVGDAIELEGDVVEFLEEFDFENHLEDLASEERMRKLISPLADDFVVNQYASKGKNTNRPGTSQRTRTQPKNEDVEPEADEEAETTRPRARRFQQLREEMAKKAAEAAAETADA